MSEGIVSFARLGRCKERGGCHRPPLEDMMEACWGGVTPSMVVSGDAGIGRVRNGSLEGWQSSLRLFLCLSISPFFPFLSL